MNAFTAVVLALAVASASASHLVHHSVHIPSGSVSVGHEGVVIAGPSGSVHTDNGLHGHGASAQLSGPAGDVATHAGLAHISGPGIGHHEHAVHAIAAPVVYQTPVAQYGVVGGLATHSTWGHQAVVAAPAHSWGHAAVIAPAAHSWGHAAVIAAPAQSWGHHSVISHGLVGHRHHGW